MLMRMRSAAAALQHSQDVLYLADKVLGVGALPLQGDAVPHPLLVQPGQLRLGQRQAHAALVPVK